MSDSTKTALAPLVEEKRRECLRLMSRQINASTVGPRRAAQQVLAALDALEKYYRKPTAPPKPVEQPAGSQDENPPGQVDEAAQGGEHPQVQPQPPEGTAEAPKASNGGGQKKIKEYNPAQPRDAEGKWSETGASRSFVLGNEHLIETQNTRISMRVREGDITAQEFDPDAEAMRLTGVVSSMRDIVSDEGFLRAMGEDGMIGHEDWNVNVGAIFTKNPRDAGMGSAGEHSAKVFYSPYESKDRPFIRLSEFGVDPIYVSVHELHHAFGSDSELDMFSDFAAAACHYSLGDTLVPDMVKFTLSSHLGGAIRAPERTTKSHVKQMRVGLAWLNSKYPEKVRALVLDYYGEKDAPSMLERMSKWKYRK